MEINQMGKEMETEPGAMAAQTNIFLPFVIQASG